MKMTLTYTADTYVVHELLTKDDPVTPCDLPDSDAVFDYYITNPSVMHVSEVRGSDILPDDKGFWRNLASGRGRVQDISVDAGSIQHRGWSFVALTIWKLKLKLFRSLPGLRLQGTRVSQSQNCYSWGHL